MLLCLHRSYVAHCYASQILVAHNTYADAFACRKLSQLTIVKAISRNSGFTKPHSRRRYYITFRTISSTTSTYFTSHLQSEGKILSVGCCADFCSVMKREKLYIDITMDCCNNDLFLFNLLTQYINNSIFL